MTASGWLTPSCAPSDPLGELCLPAQSAPFSRLTRVAARRGQGGSGGKPKEEGRKNRIKGQRKEKRERFISVESERRLQLQLVLLKICE